MGIRGILTMKNHGVLEENVVHVVVVAEENGTMKLGIPEMTINATLMIMMSMIRTIVIRNRKNALEFQPGTKRLGRLSTRT